MIRKKNSINNKTIQRGGPIRRSASFAFKENHMSKKKNKNQVNPQIKNHFELRKISPLTPNQQKTFDAYDKGQNLILHGFAGTGKTFISLYLALEEVLESSTLYDKIIIVRSVVPSRDVGFLPGNIKEKTRVYEEPYKEICDDLFGNGNGYDILKMRNIINFTTTSFLRGLTFNNAIVIVDEIQNMSDSEINTIMTRIGNNSRVIICGDFRQTDLQKYETGGLRDLIRTIHKMNIFEHIEFEITDICRSGFAKSYIIAREEIKESI